MVVIRTSEQKPLNTRPLKNAFLLDALLPGFIHTNTCTSSRRRQTVTPQRQTQACVPLPVVCAEVSFDRHLSQLISYTARQLPLSDLLRLFSMCE